MNNKKQTAVEWLSNQAYELFEQYSEGNFDRITLNKLMMKATEQAKAMDKQQRIEDMSKMQIIDDVDFDGNVSFIFNNIEEYYKKTYEQ